MFSRVSIRRCTMSGCFIFDHSSHWRWFKTAFEVETLWFILCRSVFILELEFISMKQKLSQVNHLVILRYFFKLEAWKLLSQFGSVTQPCPTLCDPMNGNTPGLPVHHQLPVYSLMSIESVIPSNHFFLCCPLLPPSIFLSIRVFSDESVLHIRWPKYWSFSFNISLSNEYSGLISFRMDWLDLLTVQETQESSPTPQFKSINSSELSFLYGPTLTSIHDHRKNHSLD